MSFWELIDTQFGTRLDSSKNETKLALIGSDDKPKSGKGKDVSTQMKYEQEVFITGSEFDAAFVLDTYNPIVESCFYRAVELFREFGMVGGQSARDCGQIDVVVDIPVDGSRLYLDYLAENREKMFQNFTPRLKEAV